MIAVRRYLVVLSLMVWQGGFLFYAAIVVPIGTDVLGSASAQGAITARVTDVLNLVGCAALIVLALDVRSTRDANLLRLRLRWLCWSIAFLCQGLLVYLHLLLDFFMDEARTRVVIAPPFLIVHGAYLWAMTLQWLACLLLIWLALQAWRAEDRQLSRGT